MNPVDTYIHQFPKSVQDILMAIRRLIFKHAPFAQELISYKMPAYKIDGKPLMYFAGYKHHIGVYALPSSHEHFKFELGKYKQGKGSVQFPISDSFPYELLERMIIFRLEQMKSDKK